MLYNPAGGAIALTWPSDLVLAWLADNDGAHVTVYKGQEFWHTRWNKPHIGKQDLMDLLTQSKEEIAHHLSIDEMAIEIFLGEVDGLEEGTT